MRNILMGVLFGLLASQSPAAVRAVIPDCCVSSGSISVLNPTTGAIEHTLTTGTVSAGGQSAISFAITKGGESAAVVNVAQTSPDEYALNIVDLATGEISAHLALPSVYDTFGYYVAANPKNSVVYLSHLDYGGNAYLQAFDSLTLAPIQEVNLGTQLYADPLIVSPDGQTIYMTGSNQIVALAASTLELIGTIFLPTPAGSASSYSTAISPDSSKLYAQYLDMSYASNLAFIDTKTLQVVQTVPYSSGIGEIGGISPDGSQLYMKVFLETGITTLSVLNIATLITTLIPTTIDGGFIAVSPNGLVYLAGGVYVPPFFEGIAAQVTVIDPATQTILATAPLLSSSEEPYLQLAVNSDGSQVYCLNVYTSSLALAGVPPSETILDTVQMGSITLGHQGGVYDHKDNLLLLPDNNWYVDVFDAATLQLDGLLYIQGLAGSAAFGDAGYVPAADSDLGPRVVQFDPVSMQVTGSVALPSGYEFYNFGRPALNGHRLYVPLWFYGGIKPLIGIAVIDTTQMTLVATWPFAVLPKLAVAPDGEQGYVLQVSDYPTLLKISMRTGQVLQSIQMPAFTGSDYSMVLSPDGSTIYLSVNSTLYAISSQNMTISNSAPGFDLSTLTISPDGNYLYGQTNQQCEGCYMLGIVSTSSLQLVGTIPSAQPPGPVLFIEQ
jgi:hypothetical protein